MDARTEEKSNHQLLLDIKRGLWWLSLMVGIIIGHQFMTQLLGK